jgi:hypothetical protein
VQAAKIIVIRGRARDFLADRCLTAQPSCLAAPTLVGASEFRVVMCAHVNRLLPLSLDVQAASPEAPPQSGVT